MPGNQIGARIKTCREASGVSQAWLAEALGINRSTISRYEKGVTGKITISTIEKIAALLGTTTEYLYYGGDVIVSESSETEAVPPHYVRAPGLVYGKVKKESEINDKNIAQICKAGSFVMSVETEELAPRIVPGDRLTIVVSEEIQNKYINVLLINGKIKMCRLTCENDIVTFMPANGAMYPEICTLDELKEKMKIVGYVERLESSKP